jgi:hypothetical protein
VVNGASVRILARDKDEGIRVGNRKTKEIRDIVVVTTTTCTTWSKVEPRNTGKYSFSARLTFLGDKIFRIEEIDLT